MSVVVCAYTERRWEALAEAVASARAQTVAPLEVILVIDHNPGLLARAQEHLDGVRALANAGEQGLSGARNTGVAAAGGEIVAFLDDDAVAAPDWLERLLAPYADPEVLGVGGAIEPRWDGVRPAGFPSEFGWVVGCTYTGMPERTAPVRNLIGANMSLRRAVLQQVGGFRSDLGRIGTLPAGCEETELCIRARQTLGRGRFVYEPAARVDHAVPAERAAWRYFRSRCWSEGLSKAQVAAIAGAGDGLSTERAYTLRVLPAGAWRGVREAARGDRSGLVRAGAICAGLGFTTAGYLVGTLRAARA